MRLIDADALLDEVCDEYHNLDRRFTASTVIRLIKDAPSINTPDSDMVKVVRCKNCAFFIKTTSFSGKCTLRGDNIFMCDYCSYSSIERECR